MNAPEFEPMAGIPNWSRALVEDDDAALAEMARRLNRTRRKGEYFVCGFLKGDVEREVRQLASIPHEVFQIEWQHGHQLFRIETNDPIEIIRAFDVGRQGENSYGSDPETVWQELAMIHAQNPIVPYFADEAALECEFEQPISDDFAVFLNATLTQGLEEYGAEEESGDLADWVKRDGYLRLWWD